MEIGSKNWKKYFRWYQAEREVSLMPEFQSEDFAVVWEPIMTHSMLPKNKNGIVPIHEFLSIDCLHFRQKTNAWCKFTFL